MGLIGEDTEDDVGEKANMSHNSDWIINKVWYLFM